MPSTITASVGAAGGVNRSFDVGTVQRLLNQVPPLSGGPSPPLQPDSKCGPMGHDVLGPLSQRAKHRDVPLARTDSAGARQHLEAVAGDGDTPDKRWEARSGYTRRGATIVFDTASGRLSAAQRGEGEIELDFPADPASPCPPPADLLASLGAASSRFTGRNRLDHLVELNGEAAVRAFTSSVQKIANRGRHRKENRRSAG